MSPVATYSAGSATIDVVPSLRGFHRSIERQLKTMNPTVNVGVNPQMAKFNQQITKATQGRTVNVKVEANAASLKKAVAEVEAAEKRLRGAAEAATDARKRQQIEETKLAEVRGRSNAKASQVQAQELKVAQATREAHKATVEARNSFEGLMSARDKAKDLKLKVDADTSAAMGVVSRLQAFIRSIHGVVHVSADTRRADSDLRQLARRARITGYVSLTVLGAGALGMLATLPALLTAAAGPAAALAVGMQGVGDAFKAHKAAAEGASAATQSAGKAASAAARQIANASDSVTQAAKQRQRAEVDAARAEIAAKRQVLQAEQALTRARDEAARAVKELAFQVRGGRIAEEEAAIAVAEAEAELKAAREAGVSGTDLRKLELAYDKQALSLDEIKSKNQELSQQSAKAAAVGVEGSDQVLAATEQLRQAEEARAESRLQSERSIEDAIASQAAAARGLQDAQTSAAESAGSVNAAVLKVNDAMAKLSPNARGFVQDVLALKPAWDSVKTATQDALFAGAGAGLTNFVNTILPVMKTGLVQVAQALNGVIHGVTQFLSQAPIMQLFAQLWSQIAQIITALTPLITSLIGMFLQLATAAMPAILAVVQVLSTLGPTIMQALAPLMADGTFAAALGSIAQIIGALIPIIGILLNVGVQVLSVLGPVLAQALTALQPALQAVGGALVALAPVLGQIISVLAAALVPVANALVPILGAVGKAIEALLPAVEPLITAVVGLVTPLADLLVPVINLLVPIIQVVSDVLATLAPIFTQLIGGVVGIVTALTPLITMVAQFAGQLLNALLPILPPIIEQIIAVANAFLPIIPSLVALGNVLFPTLIDVINTLMPIITFLVNLLSGTLAFVLETVVVPVLNLLINAIKVAAEVFDFLWQIVKPIFQAIGDGATWLWENMLKPAFDAIGDATERVGQFFKDMGDTIGGIWDGIKKLVHGGIQGVVDIVYNNGIRALANAVIQYIPGVEPLPELKIPAFAKGGPVFGPGTGTSDSIPALLSNGEYVMTAAMTAKYFPILEAMRANRFADGGPVGSIPAQAATETLAISATANVAGLTAIQESATAAVAALQLLANTIASVMNPAFAAMTAANQAMTEGMVNNANLLTVRHDTLAGELGMSWTSITQAVNASVADQGAAFNNLNNGLANVRQSVQHTADWAVSQWDRIKAAAADPIRWVIQQPMNAGLIAAWNKLNSDFSLGKEVAPISIGFSSGGYTGDGGMFEPKGVVHGGEFVIRKKITKKAKPFLEALNRGEPEALQAVGVRGYAAGGLVDIHGQQVGKAIAAASEFAKRESGKPYIWGGVGPAGYDCSGFMSAITNVLRGENPHKRLGVARSQPWAGFQSGLGSAFSTGFSQGHTAGTLAGVNVESGGSPSRVKYGAGAVGADHSQFSGHAFLPIAGGQFVSGGGGGAFFDPAAVAAEAFKASKELAASTAGRWPGNRAADFGGAIAGKAVEAVQAKAAEKLAVALSPQGTGGAGVEQWRGVVLQALQRMNQPASLADTVLRRMNQESGGNPRAINDWDINAKRGTPSKGLMQVIDPTFRSHRDPALPDDIWNPLSNIIASMRYALARYGSLAAAYNKAGGYNLGGVVPGFGTKDTVPARLTPGERVLPVSVTRTFDAFVANLNTASRLAENAARPDTSNAPAIGEVHVHPAPGMDERALAMSASRRVASSIRNR